MARAGRDGVDPLRTLVGTLAEAVRHPLLLPSVSHSYRFYIDNALAEHNLRIDSLLEIDSEDATIQMLKEGQGFSIIPYSMAQREVDDGKLAACLVTDPVISRTFFIATASPAQQRGTLQAVTSDQCFKTPASPCSCWLNWWQHCNSTEIDTLNLRYIKSKPKPKQIKP